MQLIAFIVIFKRLFWFTSLILLFCKNRENWSGCTLPILVKMEQLYTIRILPLGGYVRMWLAGVRIQLRLKPNACRLTLVEAGKVIWINLFRKNLWLGCSSYECYPAWLWRQIRNHVILAPDYTKTYDARSWCNHYRRWDEVIAPRDVQYQNASIWGRLITNFCGPMNNFYLVISSLPLNLIWWCDWLRY